MSSTSNLSQHQYHTLPNLPSTSSSSNSHIQSPGRQRSRTFSQAEADEKREREEESLRRSRSRSGSNTTDELRSEEVDEEGSITPGELRAEVSYLSYFILFI